MAGCKSQERVTQSKTVRPDSSVHKDQRGTPLFAAEGSTSPPRPPAAAAQAARAATGSKKRPRMRLPRNASFSEKTTSPPKTAQAGVQQQRPTYTTELTRLRGQLSQLEQQFDSLVQLQRHHNARLQAALAAATHYVALLKLGDAMKTDGRPQHASWHAQHAQLLQQLAGAGCCGDEWQLQASTSSGDGARAWSPTAAAAQGAAACPVELRQAVADFVEGAGHLCM
jgi:hypothetical protein